MRDSFECQKSVRNPAYLYPYFHAQTSRDGKLLARQRRWRLGRPDFTSSRNLLGDISQENVTNMSFVPPLCCWLLSGLSGREQMAGQQEKISLFISLSSYTIRNICDAHSSYPCSTYFLIQIVSHL